jgi:hypothetical protein
MTVEEAIELLTDHADMLRQDQCPLQATEFEEVADLLRKLQQQMECSEPR